MSLASRLLPGGYTDGNGDVHRAVEVALMSGREEEMLADAKRPANAALVTAIISRCTRRIGAIEHVSEEIARNLLVADRQYILLKLRELTFGSDVTSTIRCPWPDCGKKVDITLSINDIPVIESGDKGPTYEMQLSPEAAVQHNDQHLSDVRFRLPTGADQEAICPRLDENEAKALSLLLGSCLKSVGPLKCDERDLVPLLSPLARMEIERRMETVAPKLDLRMQTACPECGRDFETPFELQDFFFGELRTSRDLLYREVHYLAYHYHWSEKEILEMPKEKRRTYIEVLADEIESLNNAIS